MRGLLGAHRGEPSTGRLAAMRAHGARQFFLRHLRNGVLLVDAASLAERATLRRELLPSDARIAQRICPFVGEVCAQDLGMNLAACAGTWGDPSPHDSDARVCVGELQIAAHQEGVTAASIAEADRRAAEEAEAMRQGAAPISALSSGPVPRP